MNSPSNVFTDPQTTILSAWLRQEGRSQHATLPSDTDICAVDDILEAMQISSGNCNEIDALSVAVARIMLRDRASSLPQWAVVHADGQVEFARDNSWKDDLKRPVGIIPRTLFEMNWATSGPGFPWPERYSACPLPGEDITVIVASVDSTEVYGYTDFALGWVNNTDNLVEAAGEIIRDWWDHLRVQWNQPPWESIFEEGLVNNATACAWQEKVWAEYYGIYEDEEEDEEDWEEDEA